jgi:aspartyl-tRNA synthetase
MNRTWIIETVDKVGEEVALSGWVHVRRDMGKLIFIDLRDKTGICQVVFLPNHKAALAEAAKLRPEFVVTIKGQVNARPEKQVNREMPTGTVEIEALELTIRNEAETPPFEVNESTAGVSEELRMQYRFLDLRTERMQRNLQLRHTVFQQIRNFLSDRRFLEVETPILANPSPEGARDFLVPSRNFPGEVYALPQSPQQFKQLLVIGGVERYFQMAPCFRDEDTRKDRQPSFTQLDLEMSFVQREDVMALIEELLIALTTATRPDARIQQTPFPRLTYAEAMEKYGIDRPDLRENKDDPNEFAFCWVIDFPFFEKTDDGSWTFTHNPFSAPQPEYMEALLKKDQIGEIITSQYDIVLNGFEVGGGSVRNHNPEALRTVLQIIGLSDEQIDSQFGHMMRAFRHGAPPHGGIALGMDRLVSLLAGEYESIREVIAFPKTADGRDLLMNSPAPATPEQLADLGLKKLA